MEAAGLSTLSAGGRARLDSVGGKSQSQTGYGKLGIISPTNEYLLDHQHQAIPVIAGHLFIIILRTLHTSMIR